MERFCSVLIVSSEPLPVVDVGGQLFLLRIPAIQMRNYLKAIEDADQLIERLAEEDVFLQDDPHRRGKYPNISFGISMGNGQSFPKGLDLGKHSGFVKEIRDNEAFKKIVGHTDGENACSTFIPRLINEFDSFIRELDAKTPSALS